MSWLCVELKNAVIGIEFGSSRDACILDARFRSMRSIVSQSRGSVLTVNQQSAALINSLKPRTHSPETGAINSTPDSDASFWSVCHWLKTLLCCLQILILSLNKKYDIDVLEIMSTTIFSQITACYTHLLRHLPPPPHPQPPKRNLYSQAYWQYYILPQLKTESHSIFFKSFFFKNC